MRFPTGALVALALAPRAAPLAAQGAPSDAPSASPAAASRVQMSASVRARAERWDWFDAGAEGEYTYAHVLARLSAVQTRGAWSAAGEHDLRLFGLWYRDARGTVPAADRPAAARTADRTDIALTTLGGHRAAIHKAGRATFDAMAWGAWVRAGWLQTSGDAAPGDGRHETFFRVLPTPRVLARLPFHNMMNSSEAFVTVQAGPHAKVTMRAGMHDLRLTEASDLWYLGGGAFDARVFGYTGRPSSASTTLASLTDLSVAWQAHKRLALELYGAAARGGGVVKGAYGGSRDARFVHLETTLTR